MNAYSSLLVVECKRLRAAGWTPREIRRLLVRAGREPVPSLSTIIYWTNERAYSSHQEREARRQRVRKAQRATFRLPSKSQEYLTAFAVRLREEGVTRSSVAKVLTVVTGERWELERVDELLGAVEA